MTRGRIGAAVLTLAILGGCAYMKPNPTDPTFMGQGGPGDPTITRIGGNEGLFVFGNSKTLTVETYLVDYAVIGKVEALTEFAATLQPTGQPTWS